MANRLTVFSKLLITLFIVGGIAALILYLSGGSLIDGTDNNSGTENVKNNKSNGKADVKVGVFSWGGYAPGFYFNEGFDVNNNSRFKKEYGINVSFEVIDDFDANRQAWKAGEVDLIGTTADALPAEMEGLKSFDPRIVFQVDWSRGGDAIIAKRGINSINDLRGKTIAVTPATPSQSFLFWMLDAANMSLSDVNILEVPSAIDAATAFKGDKNVDAAVVWSPDDEISIREVPGSTVLQSTREASHIVADVFIAKKEWIDENKEVLDKFYEGWMTASAEINSSTSNKTKAASLMAKGTFFTPEDALASINNVRLCTHGDNLNFFGKNPDYKGVTGEKLYSRMSDEYISLGFATTKYSWRMLAHPGAISNASLSGNAHNAEGQKDFQPVTEADIIAPAISSKGASITFATGQYTLDANAKTIIDLQFSEVAKAFGNSRVRIEGNTDNVGSHQMNVELSKKRAQAVADYLRTEYNMSSNRFVIVGNGPDKPVSGCEANATEACRSKNRRTEFQLLK